MYPVPFKKNKYGMCITLNTALNPREIILYHLAVNQRPLLIRFQGILALLGQGRYLRLSTDIQSPHIHIFYKLIYIG